MQADWLASLRSACDAPGASQAKVARRLGVSEAVVSKALNGKYGASLRSLEQRVRERIIDARIKCPVLFEITREKCRTEQRRPFASTNPQRVALYRACRNGCINKEVI